MLGNTWVSLDHNIRTIQHKATTTIQRDFYQLKCEELFDVLHKHSSKVFVFVTGLVRLIANIHHDAVGVAIHIPFNYN